MRMTIIHTKNAGSSRRPGSIHAGWLTGALMVVLMVPMSAAGQTVIDFEDMAPAIINAEYGPQGVIFDQAHLNIDPLARSGTRLLRTYAINAEVFQVFPMRIVFTSGQARVKLFAVSPGFPVNGTLRAFNAADAMVAEDGPKLIAGDSFNAMFEVSLATEDIVRVELIPELVSNLAIDDLEFEGAPPAPPPPTPPTVEITTPTHGAELDIDTLDIAGTITGEGILSSTVRVQIDFRRPPESTAPTFTSALSVTGTGANRAFSLPGGFGGTPMGPITITVQAQNIGGLTGSDSVTINNLPQAIRDRVAAEQAAGQAVGAFSFGVVNASCQIAIFANAAVTTDSVGTTRVIRGEILTKWLSLRDSFDTDGIGCPLEEERDSPPAPGMGLVQGFADGRIYTTEGIGTFFVPNVFLDVIDKRGGEAATGVPISDTSDSSGAMQTWLFQRFHRPVEAPDLLPSTIEIRGTPPRVYLQRPSGDLRVVSNGTIVEHFPCEDILGPCSVDPRTDPPAPLENPGQNFCDNTTFFPGLRGPREWENIRDRFSNDPHAGDYTVTSVFGAVLSSKLASTDLTLTHEWFFDCPPVPLRLPFDCPSDYLVQVRPYGPHTGVGTFRPQSLFAGTSSTRIKLEYEKFYADFVVWMGYPREGDLIFTAGRWIIDCGHDTFKSELHPIFMYSTMRTVTFIIEPFTGLRNDTIFGGEPATQANIWVNGWYPGHDPTSTVRIGGRGNPIEFDIFPPPRHSPDAKLVVNKPVDADAAFGVGIEWSLEPPGSPNHVHIKFTAPYREPHVTDYGEMIWEINRGYEGQWFLFWED